jgi:protein CpxP
MMMRHPRFDPEAPRPAPARRAAVAPDQDGALKAYLAATGPRTGARTAPGANGPPTARRKSLTTPERLDRETEHLDRAKARIDATRAFYAALSPSQKKAFDALGPMGGGPGPRMRRVEFRRFKGGPDGPAGASPKATRAA